MIAGERLGFVGKTVLLAGVYAATAILGLRIHAAYGFASLVWPPTGIAIAALVLGGGRYWPAIAAGAFAANLQAGAPFLAAAGIAAGNTLEAVFGAWVLRRIPGFTSSLRRVADALALLVLAGVFGTMISATFGTTSLLLAHTLPPDGFALTWRDWWLGDLVGAIVVAPFLLTLSDDPEVPRRSRLVEGVVLAVLLAGASVYLFESRREAMVILLCPLFVWAALRFEQRGAARAALLVSAIAIWATVRGHGPFARGQIEDALFGLESFVALTAGTFLVLGAAVAERRKADVERKVAESGIRESEERYRSLTDSVDLLIWVNDESGRITYVNRRWFDALGVDLAHASGMRWTEVIHPEDLPRVIESRNRGFDALQPYQAEFRCRFRDGGFRWMLARVVPLKDGSGRVLSWFGSASDVHELKTAQEELRRAKEEAEHANRAKDQFLAALSHELRTPLTPVLALASSLESDSTLPADTRRRISVLRRNTELEARLIDDLLDLTRIARGKLHVEREPVSLRDAITHVLEICREDASAKGVALEQEGSDAETSVLADPARLRQIFWNIVKNGIKFTPAGGRVVVRMEPPSAGRVAVEVSDTGVGIERSELARIFRPFEQGGSRAGGLGLGLAIASALVDAHGGTLTAASGGPGLGATFRVELAVADREAASVEPRRSRPKGTAVLRRRVLLVEDHVDTLDVARELLTELACEVITAGSVAEAIRMAESSELDLVVSDLGLPDGTGIELMRALRERHGLAGIAVTGYGMEEDVRSSFEAGFVDHLVKPITFQRLAAALDRFFGKEIPD